MIDQQIEERFVDARTCLLVNLTFCGEKSEARETWIYMAMLRIEEGKM